LRRVVITGVGAVTPIGNDAKKSFENLINGVSGVSKITRFDTIDFKCKIAAEVKNFNLECVEKKELKKMDLFVQYALAASVEAWEDSGITDYSPEQVGVAIGTGIGGLGPIEKYTLALEKRGERGVSPFFIPMSIVNMSACRVSMKYNFQGPNFSAVTACATGTHSIGLAVRSIQYGDADIFVAGGSESTITPLSVAGFTASKTLSLRNDEPEAASRPFDRDRDGFVMGEGSGILVLEEYEHAVKRDAHIYAEVIGFGMSGDAYHIVAPSPHGKGAALAMRKALEDAKIATGKVGYINAHGTSTIMNDIYETEAIKAVFGEYAKQLMVSSTKSSTGHLLGAAGGVEAVFSALAIDKSVLPPTINLDNPDPQCDLDYIPKTARRAKVDVAMSNSFGFGGTNAVLLFGRV